MKKLTYLLLLLVHFANASNISFPDQHFLDKLLEANTSNNIAKDQNGVSIKIDLDNNLQISTLEALAVYQLDISFTSNINDITGILSFVNLEILNAQGCQIDTNVDLSNMIHLQNVNLKNNQNIENINVTGCFSITNLNVKYNNIQTIDVSTLLNLTDLDVSNNTNLHSIFAKNGANETIILNGNNSNLYYICVDEAQIADLQSQLTNNCIVNSYCTFEPGGNYNRMTGRVIFDVNNNGTEDLVDLPQPNIKLTCDINSNLLYSTCNTNGQYAFYSRELGNFTLFPNVENPSWFAVTSTNGIFNNINDNIYNHNFLITPVGEHYDVEIIIKPINELISGANTTYEIIVKNKGNKTYSGQMVLNYPSINLSSPTINVPIVSSNIGSMTVDCNNLLPFENKMFIANFETSSALAVNSQLDFNATIASNGEEPSTLYDNTFTLKQKVVNDLNPNRIECLEGNSLPESEIGKFLHYNIIFENTGNQIAKNVTVKTVFETSRFDINSIQILNSSHPFNLKVAGPSVLYNMKNANLGGPGGQGGVLLKVKSNANLTSGSTVATNAEIFFDYDPLIDPINTSTDLATTTFQSLNVSQNNIDVSISTYPNPTSSIVNVETDSTIKSIQLYDINGRLLQTNLTSSNKATIDVTTRSEGIYFLKITSEKGQKVEQILKK